MKKIEANHKLKPIIGLSVLIIIALSIFLYNRYTANLDTLKLNGSIENQVVSAVSTVSGKIVEMNKNQGEKVKKDDVIATIDSRNQEFAIEQLQAVVDLKSAKIEEIKAGARPQQIKQLEAQVKAAKAQWDLAATGSRAEQKKQAQVAVSIATEAVNTAQISYDYVSDVYENAQTAFDKGLMTQADLDGAKYKKDLAARQLSTAKYQKDNASAQYALVLKGSTSQAVSAAKANYEAAKSQLDLAKAGATEQTITMAEADLRQATIQLNQAKSMLENYKITALADGIIISKNFQLGDVVNITSNLADIAIDNDLYVIAYIPDKYLGKIKYGQMLKVTSAAGTIEGEVIYIALNNEYTPKDKQSANDTKHKATKMKVKIMDSSGTLKSGMNADIEVPLK